MSNCRSSTDRSIDSASMGLSWKAEREQSSPPMPAAPSVSAGSARSLVRTHGGALRWLRHSPIERPPAHKSLFDCSCAQFGALRCISQRNLRIANRDFKSVTAVSGLSSSARPSAIFRRVTLVVIYSIERCARGLLAHVIYKCLKRFFPAVAYRNPATAIFSKRKMSRIMATFDHRPPSRGKLGGLAAKKMPMRCAAAPGHVPL